MKMKIRLISDLHLEFTDYAVESGPDADLLVLAGDIMVADVLHENPAPTNSAAANRFRAFLGKCSAKYPSTIYIAGNHEFFHGRWHGSLDHLANECAKFSNIHFLEDQAIVQGGITFVGSTLWTSMESANPLIMESVRNTMNDYRLIRNDSNGFRKLHPSSVVARHRRSLEYMDGVIKAAPGPVVIISHHAPTSLSIHERYRGEVYMNHAYYSDLSEFILDRPAIKYWFHGHMHDACLYEMGTCQVVCNPRGYETGGFKEESGWDENLVLEI